MAETRDLFDRPLRDLRVSVTDRCNFRCGYCMPAEIFNSSYSFLEAKQLLSLDELTRLLRAFFSLGVEKVRLTGGEPLLRPDLSELIRIAKKEIGLPEVALTTNGWMLEKFAPALKAAGLDRLNVSLDSLDPEIFGRMNGKNFSVERVLGGIEAAMAAGLPVKLNMVVQRSVNDADVERLAEWARGKKLTLRFIEFMDVGNHNGWKTSDVVPAREIVERLSSRWALEPVGPLYRGEVAARYRYVDGSGEVGLISSITEPFCRDCNRARLSADGKLFTCLFAAVGWDLRAALRSGVSDTELSNYLSRVWTKRGDRYSDERAERLAKGEAREKIEMSYIGG